MSIKIRLPLYFIPSVSWYCLYVQFKKPEKLTEECLSKVVANLLKATFRYDYISRF